MGGGSLGLFMGASLLLAVTPGPGVVYIVTRTLAHGRAAGVASVVGVAAGNLLNAVGAALGLAALLSVWAGAFELVKYAGAAYLVGLGVRTLCHARRDAAAPLAAGQSVAPRRLALDGLIVSALNPKTALFFAAFLPQFLDPGRNVLGQTVALGGLFVAIAAFTDGIYALIASSLAARVAAGAGLRRAGGLASGVSLIVLGLSSALTGPRRAA